MFGFLLNICLYIQDSGILLIENREFKPAFKSSLLLYSVIARATYTTNNITQAVVVSKILPMIENNGLKHLIIPDFLNAIEKDYTTRKGFLNLIKTLIEEGITSLDSFNIRTVKVYNPPIKCGLITGITSESFHGYYDEKEKRCIGGVKHDWKSTGLLSRFIPFSYEYELSKVVRFFQALAKEEHEQSTHQQTILRRIVDVKGNPELFQKLQLISQSLGQQIGGYGFRLQRSIQALDKANAVLNNRREVTQDDIDKITKLSNWMNFRNNPL